VDVNGFGVVLARLDFPARTVRGTLNARCDMVRAAARAVST